MPRTPILPIFTPIGSMLRITSTVVLLLSLSLSPRGQEYLYNVRLYKVDQSKSSNYIRSFARDGKGLIWAATDQGLVRFDGFRFDRFLEGAAPVGLRSNDIERVAVRGDVLYIGGSRGVQTFDLSDYKPKRLEGAPLSSPPVKAMAVDLKGRLWWYSDDGFLNRHSGDRVDRVRVGVYSYNSLAESDGLMWLASKEKFVAVDTGGMSVAVDSTYSRPNPYTNLVHPPAGGVQLLCHGRLLPLKRDAMSAKPVEASLDMATHILYGNGGRFLVMNKNMVIHQYMSGGGLRQDTIPLGIDVPFLISDIKDYDDHLVVGTSLGLLFVDYRVNLFNPIRSTLIEGVGLYDDPRGIVEDASNYYLSGYQYLVAYDKSIRRSEILNAEGLLSHGIVKDADTLWIASEGNGLIRFDLNTRRYRLMTTDTLYKNRFLITLALWGDRLLIGGYQNLFAYHKRSKRFEYPEIRHRGLSVSSSMVKKIEPLGHDSCLLGTDKGVFLIDGDMRVLRHYRHSATDAFGQTDRVNDILRAWDGSLWVATFDGLLHYSRDGDLLTRLSRNEGLAGNVVASLARDRDGYIWAGTYDGLSRVNPVNLEIVNYFREDGLPDNEFNHSSVLRGSSGEILMGTIGGFIRFNPQSLKGRRGSTDSIRIARIDYGSREGQVTDYNPMAGADTVIRLGKDVSYAKLHFFVNPLYTPDKPIYEYRIEGVHPDWLGMGSTPVLYLDNARAGRYTLRVRFISGSGSMDISERSFPIVVEQYFYTRPWFYALLFLLFLALVLMYIRSNLVREKKLRELRMELAQDLHDEIGGYLTGISMNVDLLKKELKLQNPYMRIIGQLGRKALFALKDGLWSLDTKTDNAQELWDRIKSITKETLEPLDIGYRFKQTTGLETLNLSIIEKRNLLYIAKECLTNAVKHGDGGFVNLEWEQRNGSHSVRVWNRIGDRPSEHSPGGHGLHNIRSRMQRIGGRMEATNGNGIFTVNLKLDFLNDKTGHHRRQ